MALNISSRELHVNSWSNANVCASILSGSLDVINWCAFIVNSVIYVLVHSQIVGDSEGAHKQTQHKVSQHAERTYCECLNRLTSVLCDSSLTDP
jgi:hypothetical protein